MKGKRFGRESLAGTRAVPVVAGAQSDSMEDYVDCPSPAEQQVPHRAWRPVRNDITRNGHPDLRGVTARLEAAPFQSNASKQRSKRSRQNNVKRCALFETLNGGRFIVFHVEDGIQFGDLEQIMHLLGEVQQFEFAALVFGGGVGADQLADAGAVDVVDFAEVQYDLFVALGEQVANRVAHHDAAFAESNAAAAVHDGDSVHLPSAKFHAH